MTNRFPILRRRQRILVFAGWLMITGCGGCTFFRNYGTGAHLDQPQSQTRVLDTKVRTMIVEVTTDPQGAVANINFKRSSGKQGIDGYVAETIRQNWPRQPSTLTVAEVTYSHEKGFSDPKLLSSTPVP